MALSFIPYAELRHLEALFEGGTFQDDLPESPLQGRYDSPRFSSTSRPLPVHLNRRSGYLGVAKPSR